jgi:hypothetical protein
MRKCKFIRCQNEIPEGRYMLGKLTCLACGEEAAREERMSWCIVQEYGKGAYTLVTPEAAKVTLKQTNQKNLRA